MASSKFVPTVFRFSGCRGDRRQDEKERREESGQGRLIVLFTDFGARDLYVGQVKAVLAEEAVAVVLRQPVLRVAALPDAVGRQDRLERILLRNFSGSATWSDSKARRVASIDDECRSKRRFGDCAALTIFGPPSTLPARPDTKLSRRTAASASPPPTLDPGSGRACSHP
jgi:hypothetical protein